MPRALSPEAQARLAEARAIAQGKPLPAPPAAKPAGGGRSAAPKSAASPPPAGAEGAPSRRGGLAIALVALLFVGGGGAAAAWWNLSGGPDLVGATADLQKGLLAGAMRGEDGRRAVAAVIRNADQMSKKDLEAARSSLEQEWQKMRDEAIDAFFTAPEAERGRLADEGIDRTLAYRKLRFGLSPGARDEGGRRQRPPKDGDRRKLFERYAEAIQAQAKKRGLDLPEWK